MTCLSTISIRHVNENEKLRLLQFSAAPQATKSCQTLQLFSFHKVYELPEFPSFATGKREKTVKENLVKGHRRRVFSVAPRQGCVKPFLCGRSTFITKVLGRK